MAPQTGFLGQMHDLAALAAAICAAPIAVVSLIKAGEHRIAAALGLAPDDAVAARDLCVHAASGALLVIEDAATDPRVAAHPLVAGAAHVRFIASLRLTGAAGAVVGTLLVMDVAPRGLTADQRRALEIIARKFRADIAARASRRESLAALRRQRAATQHFEALFRQQISFLNNTPNLVYLKTEDLRYVFYNGRFARHFGIDETGWLGQRDSEVLPAELAAPLRADDEAALASAVPVNTTREVLDADGVPRVLKFLRFAYQDASFARFMGAVAVEVTAETEQRSKLAIANLALEKLATTDGLTGITNRRGFDQACASEWLRARRTRTFISLLLLDLDHFKLLNDSQGHLVGDDCLRRVAACLQENVNRPADLVARFGGEEFAVLLADMAGPEGAAVVAERLRLAVQALALPHPASPFGVVTVSGGVVAMLPDTLEPTRLLREADRALYAAKAGGRNRICGPQDQVQERGGPVILPVLKLHDG
jgi:diguanylate cyclase (GGDEF)-like protein